MTNRYEKKTSPRWTVDDVAILPDDYAGLSKADFRVKRMENQPTYSEDYLPITVLRRPSRLQILANSFISACLRPFQNR